MKTINLPGKSCCICFLLGLVTLIASASHAWPTQSHYHEFVVSVFCLMITKLKSLLSVSKDGFCNFVSIRNCDITSMIDWKTGSNCASEEAVQNSKHTHCEWAVSWPNGGS